MSFNTSDYLIFLPAAAVVYFGTPLRFRRHSLLLASLIFYAAFIPAALVVLTAAGGFSYWAALRVERAGRERGAGVYLAGIVISGLIAAAGVHGIGFSTLQRAFTWNESLAPLDWALPVVLSMHLFQIIGYLTEVRRGHRGAERSPLNYFLYLFFFPQLMAGPIERPNALLKQFNETRVWDWERASAGVQLITWGLFKKAVIADRLALFIAPVYERPSEFGGPALLLATLAFSIQFFCDLSGYADIAVGSARILGFRLTRNFDAPFSAATLREFWDRWFITLTVWLRDTIRISSKTFHTLAAFLIMGLCFGLRTKFLVWGVLSAAAVRLSDLTEGVEWPPALRRILVFAVVSLLWIFVRASSLQDAAVILTRLGTGWNAWPEFRAIGFNAREIFLSLFFIAALCAGSPERRPASMRWACQSATLLSVLFFGIFRHFVPSI